ncbi:MAG: ABC transporter permease [Thermoanaerobaculia bacterium]
MIGTVVRAGWLQLRRDKGALMLSFAVPIVFFSIFAMIFGGRGGNTTPKVDLAIVDQDQSPRSKKLVAALKAEGGLDVVVRPGETGPPFDAASAEAYVRAGNAPVALIIPRGFSEQSLSFGPDAAQSLKVTLLSDTSDPIAAEVVGGLLQKSVMSALPDTMIEGGMSQFEEWSGGLTPEQKSNLDTNSKAAVDDTAAQPSAGGSSMSLLQVETKDLFGEKKKSPLVAFYAAGIGVMFLLFTATGAGGAILEEHESGTLDRLLSTRLNMTQLLAGKLIYLTTLGVVQLIVMFTWGALLFGLELQQHIPGFLLMTLSTALACSAFGLMLASVSKTRAQLAALSTMVVLTMSALGGSMFPRFLMPEGLKKAGLVFFNSWALEGFTDVFWREEPLLGIVPEVAVLLAFALLFFAIARVLSRKWEVA